MKCFVYPTLFLFVAVVSSVQADIGTGRSVLPTAPPGFEWRPVEKMSDEFNARELDASKWNKYVPSWRGRPPAEFLPKNAFVKDGHLKIRTSTHPNPNDRFKIAGGAVSGRHQQTFGYFEARLKASRTKMSTTFWLHSDKDEKRQEGCSKKHSIELDILEAIGGWPNSDWTNFMNSNTHYKAFKDGQEGCERLEYLSKGYKYDTGVNLADDFHVFASWWVNPNTFHFYFDGKKVATVVVDHERDKRPFDGPMSLRMVSETYYWQVKFAPEGVAPYPSEAELDDARINAISYDYVRSYKLVPMDANHIENPDFESSDLRVWKKVKGKFGLSDAAFEGHSSLQLSSKGAMRQKIQVKPGKPYNLTAYAKNLIDSGSSSGARFVVTNKKGVVLADKPIVGSTFSLYELPFRSSKQKTVYISIINDSPVDILVDNIAVVPKG